MTGEELSETLAKNWHMKPETSTSTCFLELNLISVGYLFNIFSLLSLKPETSVGIFFNKTILLVKLSCFYLYSLSQMSKPAVLSKPEASGGVWSYLCIKCVLFSLVSLSLMSEPADCRRQRPLVGFFCTNLLSLWWRRLVFPLPFEPEVQICQLLKKSLVQL